jgi:prephenate dehydrogenase
MFNRVTIVGLGLIGESIGLALHNAKAAQQIAGFDIDKGVTNYARKIGAIDQAFKSLVDAVRGAEIVILATPIGSIRSLLQNIATVAAPGSIITDVACTKAQIINWAEEYLPTSVFFVGGHPIVKNDMNDVRVASATLFKNRLYCLTPTKRTSPTALDKLTQLIHVLEARVRFLEPAEHDGLVAGVNHLPFVISAILMNTLADGPAWEDASMLAGKNTHAMTSLASNSPEVYRDICLTNRESLARWLSEYIRELSTFRDQLIIHDSKLIQIFSKSQQVYDQWQTAQDSDKHTRIK